MPELLTNILIAIAAFMCMEGVAWLTHKYIMHGLCWHLHQDHHYKDHKGFLERNDFFFLIFAISAGVAVFGSTLAVEQVNPRRVHSEVMCLMPLSCIAFAINFTTSGCMMTALLGTNVPTPIA